MTEIQIQNEKNRVRLALDRQSRAPSMEAWLADQRVIERGIAELRAAGVEFEA